MPATKTTVSGTVDALVADRKAFKINNAWYQLHPTRCVSPMPEKGAAITFDGYGENQNVVYRWSFTDGTSPTNVRRERTNGSLPPSKSSREAALLAAATLNQNVADPDERLALVLRDAKAMEEWLKG